MISSKIPKKSFIEEQLPIKGINKLALKEGNYKKPIYRIHKWWARRLGSVVRSQIIGALLPSDASEEEFWNHFYSKNSIDITVLDPFMGGGTCLVEAKKMGAKTVGVDINPLACFITKKELEDCDYKKVEDELKILENKAGKKIRELYITEVNGKKYPIINVFWVYEAECPSCSNKVRSYSNYKIYYNDNEQYVFCKECEEVHKIDRNLEEFECEYCKTITNINKSPYNRGICTCNDCGERFRLKDYIAGRENLAMFALEYEKKGQRYFKKAEKRDLEIYEEVRDKFYKNKEKYRIPDSIIPTENREDMRPVTHGYNYYKELFNERQLLSLGMLYNSIMEIEDRSLREWFIAGFSDSLACNNLLCSYAYGYRKLTPLFSIHAYTVPARPVENNVWGASYGRGTFEKAMQKIIRSKKFCKELYESRYDKNDRLDKVYTGEEVASIVTNDAKDFYDNKSDSLILNRNSAKLDEVEDNSVDLILTDPPYYDNLHYSELADFYYQWIKHQINSNEGNPIQDSLYANQTEDNYHEDYERCLTDIFKEGYKKLKDEGIMIFSYHHNKKEAWAALGNAIKEAGFVITNVLPVRSEGVSGYHSSEGSIKWDSIIVSRKKKKEFNINVSNIKEELTKSLQYWIDYIKNQKLEMKECDKLSFYRSLAMMIYTKSNNETNLLSILNLFNE
ncbi:DNA methyltransferase [Orenia marismortui]|uniref:Adenine-specific DNA methylase n=1 Tax=Orenia marismortui TaxID=46469 RepID=A0A4R8GYW3_9FIRM|nr:DNA methyltransferase [Orenia marismortui]TDX49147.1 adenine-specific DNA methylase [Orenia marismortui]